MKNNINSTIHLLIVTSLVLITFWLISADSVIADNQTCQPSGGKVGISISSTELQKTASGSTTARVMVCWSDNAFDKPAIVVLMAAKTGESVNTDEEVNNHKKASWDLEANADAGLKTYEWDYSGSGATDQATSYILTVKAFDDALNSSGHHDLITDQIATVGVTILPAEGTGDGTGTEDDQTANGGGTVQSDPIDLSLPGDFKIESGEGLYNSIINFFRYAVVVAALIGIIYGGITILEGAADQQKIAGAKKMIRVSIVGLILAVFTNLIISATINIILSINDITR